MFVASIDKDVEAGTVDLLREWVRWWVSTNGAPLEMPDALHLRTSLHLAKRALERLQQAGDIDAKVTVCEICFRVTHTPREHDIDYCDRCRRGYAAIWPGAWLETER
jgi:hypothetical protein